MADTKGLRRIYETTLANDPFPTAECSTARLSGQLHGELILYLADIAGLASRGEGLSQLQEREKKNFRVLASRSLYQRCPALEGKITATATPKLKALVDATEHARQLIEQALAQ
jgi:hypothetical protein